MFSHFRRWLWQNPAMDGCELLAGLRTSYTPRPTAGTIKCQYNVSGWLNGFLHPIVHHSHPHQFKIAPNDKGRAVLYYKQLSSDKVCRLVGLYSILFLIVIKYKTETVHRSRRIPCTWHCPVFTKPDNFMKINRKIGLRHLVRTGLYYVRTNFHEVPMKFTFFQDGGRRHFEIRKKSNNRAPGSCSHGSILYTYKFSRSSDEIYFFPRWRQPPFWN